MQLSRARSVKKNSNQPVKESHQSLNAHILFATKFSESSAGSDILEKYFTQSLSMIKFKVGVQNYKNLHNVMKDQGELFQNTAM